MKTRKGWKSEVPWTPRAQDVVPWPRKAKPEPLVALCAKPGCTWEATLFNAWCGFHCPFDERTAAQGKARMGKALPPMRNPFGGRGE